MFLNRFYQCLLFSLVLCTLTASIVRADDSPGTDSALPNSALNEAASSPLDSQSGEELSSLENKFFFHDFPTDTPQVRLDRIERLLYGSARAGSVQDRMGHILSDVHMSPSSADAAHPPVSASPADRREGEVNTAYQQNSGTTGYPAAAANPSGYPVAAAYPPGYPAATANPAGYPVASANPSGYPVSAAYPSGYPAATANPAGYPVAAANPSGYPVSAAYPSGDPAATANPSGYPVAAAYPSGYPAATANPSGYPAAVAYPPATSYSPENVSAAYSQSNESLPDSTSIKGPQKPPSLKAEVSSMEQQVYGKTYTDSLNNRVARLEQTVFSTQPTKHFSPLPSRISSLMAALQPTFSQTHNLYASTPVLASSKNSRRTDEEKQKQGHPFLKKLGQDLGRTVMAAGTMAGSMEMSSMMSGGMSNMMGGYGGGYGGMLGSYGSYGGYGMNSGMRW